MLTRAQLHKFDKNYSDVDNEMWNTGILKSVIKENVDHMQKLPNEEQYFQQGKTGYCWILSTLFCISKYLEQTQKICYRSLSKTYLIFWDKLEKANKFLEQMIEYADYEIKDEKIIYMLNNAITDKGQWSMAENLIQKYGLVPYDSMPDFTEKTGTGELNACLNYMLRIYVYAFRSNQKRNSKEYIQSFKNDVLFQVYRLLVKFLGKPPQMFKVPIEFNNACQKIDPITFFEDYIAFPFDEYCSICSIGENLNINYEIDLDGNVIEGKKNNFLSIPNEIFDNLILKQITNEHFCWCGCDAGKFYIQNEALYDDSIFELQDILGINLYKDIDRGRIFQYRIALPSHSVVMFDIKEVEDKKYFILHDSAQINNNKFCYMSESWYQKYVFQAIVKKEYLKEYLNLEQIKTKVVDPWEIFHIVI